jgi:hypothetical protein
MKRLSAGLLTLGLMAGCATASQRQLDAEVDRLCAVDGGLKIYETVRLPPEKFNKYNQINFYHPGRDENALGPEYIWKYETRYLHPGGDPKTNPRMWRDHIRLFRRSDGHLLGESINYSRYGGDPRFLAEYSGAPESHYSCPEKGTGEVRLFEGVFIKNDTGRIK